MPASRRRPHRVVVLALDSVVPFDLGVPCQVFGYGGQDPDVPYYRLVVCAPKGHRRGVGTANGFSLMASRGLGALRSADTVIVPGIADLESPLAKDVRVALRSAHARGARIVSICTGAFVLAAAGLLDQKRATTHWLDAPRLATRFPRVCVTPDVLYVDEGQVLTSAGMAAGIDLCLHLVRRDYGADVANRFARRLVVAPHRSGGQAQYAEQPVSGESGNGGGGSAQLEPTRDWMLAHLAKSLTVDAMAEHARMSRRSFVRHFRAETGTSPLRWLLHQRVLRAQRLLETSREGVERIAVLCGFGSALSLRQHFRRVTSVSPIAYRRTFQCA